jgi:hypothetical protein
MLDSFNFEKKFSGKTKHRLDYHTRKNCSVEPPATTPYLIFVCFDKSSALSIGLTNFSTVKKAAKQ